MTYQAPYDGKDDQEMVKLYSKDMYTDQNDGGEDRETDQSSSDQEVVMIKVLYLKMVNQITNLDSAFSVLWC